jgi:hypothetical protein
LKACGGCGRALLEARDTAGIAERWQLEPARARVFVGGFVALHGLCEALAVEHLEVSEGALREGLIYDLLGRIRHEDVRDRTIADVIRRFDLDESQAARVSASALDFLRQVRAAWDLNGREARHVLDRAARLHEIGLLLTHDQYHKHGAYVLEHSDLPATRGTINACSRHWCGATGDHFPSMRSHICRAIGRARRAACVFCCDWRWSCIAGGATSPCRRSVCAYSGSACACNSLRDGWRRIP